MSDGTAIDVLLDRAVAAINRGDREGAASLAARVLAVDHDNVEATDLLGAPTGDGEIRRLTILFADLVDSTVLSTRVEPETYHLLVGRYREQVHTIVDRYAGHIGTKAGDGLLAVFGHPVAHEDDVRRAVQAGLDITAGVARMAEEARRRFGLDLAVRVGVHRGLVYLDTANDDVYGLAANLAARVSGLAPSGTIVISDAVEPLVRNSFELQALPPAPVKGVDGLIGHHLVLAERADVDRSREGRLVGRDYEVERLQQHWSQVAAGRTITSAVALRGEAGIGKTRLAVVVAELAEQSHATVLELIGSPFHSGAGLNPVRSLLERRCGINRLTHPEEKLQLLQAEVLARGLEPQAVIPLLAPVLGITAGYGAVHAEGSELYKLVVEASQTYLKACFGDRPGLVIAEDVHWFDTSTLDVLGALVKTSSHPMLVVLTTREKQLPDDWPIEELELKPLTDKETDALIKALDPGMSAGQRDAVAARCDGVPFYIEQVVNAVDEAGVPEALYEPLFARLRARANVVPVLEAAAVIGRHIDRGLLCSVVGLDSGQVDAVLDELVSARVLEPRAPDGWQFRHELLREVAGELAPPSVRRGLHARVAEALVGAGGDPDWLLVARHYERADRHGDAAAAYQRASGDARRRGALAEACNDLTHALTQLEPCAPGPDRDHRELGARLERSFLTAAAGTHVSPDLAAEFERCLQLGGTDLHGDELFATLTALAGYYSARSDVDRLSKMVDLLRAGLNEGRQWLQPVIDGADGVAHFYRGEFESARLLLERATADWADNPHDLDAVWFVASDPIASSYQRLAVVRMVQADFAGAAVEVAHAMHRADGLGFPQGPFSSAFTRFAEAMILTEEGRYATAAPLSADLIRAAEVHGLEGFRLVGVATLAAVGGLAAISSHPVDSTPLESHIRTLTDVIDTFRAIGLHSYISFFYGVLARLLVSVGDLDGARERLNEALRLSEDTGMHFYDAELLRLRAATHALPDAIRADLESAHQLACRQGATLFERRAALDLAVKP